MFLLFGPIAFAFAALLTLALWGLRKIIGWAAVFWTFFAFTAFLNALLINTAYHDSDLDDWMGYVGPSLIFFPFAFMLYCMERRNRKPTTAAIVSCLGALPVTALWLLASAYMMG